MVCNLLLWLINQSAIPRVTRFSTPTVTQNFVMATNIKPVGYCRLYLTLLNKNILFIPFSLVAVVSSPAFENLVVPSFLSVDADTGYFPSWGNLHSLFYKTFHILRLLLPAGYSIYTPLKVICSICYQFSPIFLGIPDWILRSFWEI